ncbi:MAG: stage III sporulation protein AG [Oscillospiraceae bacterium]|jgi:stage III sporulation protein AG|nr:stage III sporulation protein AG [Oscillospiraceae bacterium]
MNSNLGKIWDKLKKSGVYGILIIVLFGALLLLLPSGGDDAAVSAADAPDTEETFSLAETEARISGALSGIDGAGRVTVVLTLKSSAETVIAADRKTSEKSAADGGRDAELTESAVIIGKGGSVQSPVTLKRIYPEYLGALIVAQGAGDASVRLELTRAVAGLTGLGTDKITVTKMKNS